MVANRPAKLELEFSIDKAGTLSGVEFLAGTQNYPQGIVVSSTPGEALARYFESWVKGIPDAGLPQRARLSLRLYDKEGESLSTAFMAKDRASDALE